MIYWITREPVEFGSKAWIGRATLSGTEPTPKWVADTALFGAESHGPLSQITISADEYIFYNIAENSGGKFWLGRLKLDGTSPEPHFIEIELPEGSLIEGIVAQGEYLYFRVIAGGKYFIGRVKTNGEAPEPEWVELPAGGTHLTSNSARLYFDMGKFIGRVKHDGSGLEPEWFEAEVEEATEAETRDLHVSEEACYFIRTLYYESPAKIIFNVVETDLTASPTPTIIKSFEGEPGKVAAPEALTSAITDVNHIYTGYLLSEGEYHGIGRFTGESFAPEWVDLEPPAETFSLVTAEASQGEPPEEGTNTVLVKAGGSLVSGRRYVKAGGKLVPA